MSWPSQLVIGKAEEQIKYCLGTLQYTLTFIFCIYLFFYVPYVLAPGGGGGGVIEHHNHAA